MTFFGWKLLQAWANHSLTHALCLHPAGGLVRALVVVNALRFQVIYRANLEPLARLKCLHSAHIHPLQLKMQETAAAYWCWAFAWFRENAGSAVFTSSIRGYAGISRNGRGVYAGGGLWICRKKGLWVLWMRQPITFGRGHYTKRVVPRRIRPRAAQAVGVDRTAHQVRTGPAAGGQGRCG